ncbi:MAG: OmpH family outer membrane protein [Bacillota bacterium]|nr:OmpH family outer membrane protein [Bacillota bacterium]
MLKLNERRQFILALAAVSAVALVVSLAASLSVTRADKLSQVGVVDTMRLLNEFPAMKEVQASLEQETARLQKEYDEKSKNLSQEEKVKLFQQYQAGLDAQKEALLRQARQKILATIEAVARQEGLAVVMDQQAVLYGGKDITELVLQRAQAEGKKAEEKK